MYRRPIFSLFTTENAKIASTGDPVNPTYDDGSEEETPDGEDSVVKYPSGTLNALHFGKLLASGEAGYFDIQNQDYQIERLNSDDVVIKPKGEGIDYVYPNPPDLEGFSERNEYWGLPSGSTKAFFQSGIFIKHNDDAKHLTGSGLQYFNSSSNYNGSIFNINNSRSSYSLGNISDFRKNFFKQSDDVYIPRCVQGVNLKIFFTDILRTYYNFNDGPAIEPEFNASFATEVSYDPSRLIPPNNFEISASQIGTGIDLESAVINSLKNHLESFEVDKTTRTQIWTEARTDTIANEVKNYDQVRVRTIKTASSGVIGNITITSKEEKTKFNGDKYFNIETEVEYCAPEFALRDIGTRELVMHHKGTGEKDPDADENAPIELSPILIPYLGDYKVIKPNTGQIVKSTEDEQDTYDIKACDAVKSRLEKILEGDEELIQQEEEKSETTDGTTQDNTQ
jgi:hypothetical protein